jgi:hypothetical protein
MRQILPRLGEENNIALQQDLCQNTPVSSTLLLWWIQRNSPELRFFFAATRV